MVPNTASIRDDRGVGREITDLIVRMARENSDWGYDRIAGALKNLGHCVSDQTVGNVLRRFGIAPAPRVQTARTAVDDVDRALLSHPLCVTRSRYQILQCL